MRNVYLSIFLVVLSSFCAHFAAYAERNQRRTFVHFLQGLLHLDPAERYTPDEARLHPFIRGKPCETLPAFDQYLAEARLQGRMV